MKATTLKLYALDYRDIKAYIAASAFILGNMGMLLHIFGGYAVIKYILTK